MIAIMNEHAYRYDYDGNQAPTRDEIQQQTASIRARWTPEDRRRRYDVSRVRQHWLLGDWAIGIDTRQPPRNAG